MTFTLTLEVFCRGNVFLYCKCIVMMLITISQQLDCGGIALNMREKNDTV